MELLGTLLLIVGIPLLLGSQIYFLILGFKDSFVTGIGILFFPIIGIILGIMRLPATKIAVIAHAIGAVCAILGAALA
jgi:hypothetical protein